MGINGGRETDLQNARQNPRERDDEDPSWEGEN